jgi:predicted O-methyltransferase YrrM
MDTHISPLLRQLHEQNLNEVMARARRQYRGSGEAFSSLAAQYNELAPRLKGRFLQQHGLSSDDTEASQGTPLMLAVSAETGLFLKHMVLAHRPGRILEVGSSCGVSTLYFAEALALLGKGKVVATELDAAKCGKLRDNVHAANLEAYVDLHEGDVFQTIATLEAPFDMVFIDIWADAYLPVFQKIEHLLRPGSIVLADNMFTAGPAIRPFKDYLEQHPSFSSTTLELESGVEFAVMI